MPSALILAPLAINSFCNFNTAGSDFAAGLAAALVLLVLSIPAVWAASISAWLSPIPAVWAANISACEGIGPAVTCFAVAATVGVADWTVGVAPATGAWVTIFAPCNFPCNAVIWDCNAAFCAGSVVLLRIDCNWPIAAPYVLAAVGSTLNAGATVEEAWPVLGVPDTPIGGGAGGTACSTIFIYSFNIPVARFNSFSVIFFILFS